MNKEELLKEIRYYQGLVNKYEVLFSELNSYYHKPFENYSVGKKFGIFVLVNFLGATLKIPFNQATVFFIAFFVLFFWPSLHKKRKIKKNKNRIEKIHIDLQGIKNSINPIHIPKLYINQYALSKLEEYIINNRADSLKESLNLLEEELRHNQTIQEFYRLQELQAMSIEKSEEVAATIRWNNMFR